MNKELGCLLLNIKWPTVYESQFNKDPWLERKTKRKKKMGEKEIAKEWQNKRKTKRNKAGHQ